MQNAIRAVAIDPRADHFGFRMLCATVAWGRVSRTPGGKRRIPTSLFVSFRDRKARGFVRPARPGPPATAPDLPVPVHPHAAKDRRKNRAGPDITRHLDHVRGRSARGGPFLPFSEGVDFASGSAGTKPAVKPTIVENADAPCRYCLKVNPDKNLEPQRQ